jgi:hypothetical protein
MPLTRLHIDANNSRRQSGEAQVANQQKKIIVAGDVAIDKLSVRVPQSALGGAEPGKPAR